MTERYFAHGDKMVQLKMETGPVNVSIDLENDLIVLENTSPLISALSHTEQVLLQFDLQQVLNIWCERKSIAHS